jgi:hypothetical protein
MDLLCMEMEEERKDDLVLRYGQSHLYHNTVYLSLERKFYIAFAH